MQRTRTTDAAEELPEKKTGLDPGDAPSPLCSQLPYSSRTGRVPEAVPFQQPQQLLTFSYTPEHELEFTNSALRFYVDPPPGADLRYGYDRWIKRPTEEKGRLDNLLRAVSKIRSTMNPGAVSGSEWLKSIGVISWRGVMTKILTAPYEERDGWELNVMLVDGTLYFEEHSSDAKLVERNTMTPNQRVQTYYGYSFESYCTSSTPSRTKTSSHNSGWGGDVDTNVQWCSVVKTKLADTRVLIGGEVDCVRDKYTGKTDTFVELKTSLIIRHSQDEARFEKKLLKFYFQSFLLGVPEIVVGFRSPQGRLGTVQRFRTVEIPRMVRGKPGAWDPVRCLDWGKQFIAFLQSVVTPHTAEEPKEGVDPKLVSIWRVKFTPRVGVSASLLDKTGVDEVSAGEARVGFLPQWYTDELSVGSSGSGTPPVTITNPASVEAASALPSGWQI